MGSILVTGGAGFIGSCFVRQWIEQQQDHLINLDKLTYAGNLASLQAVENHPRYCFYRGDIGDRATLDELFDKHRPRAVVHFAAESHVDRSVDDAFQFVTTNVLGTTQLLDASLTYWDRLPQNERLDFRFLHVSTDEVFGSLETSESSNENSLYRPSSPYAASKAASDHLVRAYHRTYGLPTLVTHCSNNYGPFQFPEKLVPLMVLNALEGKPLPVYGDGQHVRDWLYVDDHCRALGLVLGKGVPGETYHIGANCERTNLEMVHAICDTVDRLLSELPHAPCRSLVRMVPDRPGHDRRYALDTSKIERDLGWRAERDLASGLDETITWYVANRAWIEQVMPANDSPERLGLSRSGNRSD